MASSKLYELTPCLSALDFRIMDFGVYFKLEKKSSSKPTGYFVNFEIDFFFLQISGLGYDTFHISLAFNPLFTFHRSLVYLFPVLLDSLMPVHCIESTRLVNSSSLFFKILNSFYYPRLANLNLKLGFCLLMTQTERNLLK